MTEDGKRLLVRVIGRFKKLRVREIGIPLYFLCVATQFRLNHKKEGSVELTLEKTVEQEHKTKYSSHTADLGHCFGVMSYDDLATCHSLGFRTRKLG